jgi:hypothetical protein
MIISEIFQSYFKWYIETPSKRKIKKKKRSLSNKAAKTMLNEANYLMNILSIGI